MRDAHSLRGGVMNGLQSVGVVVDVLERDTLPPIAVSWPAALPPRHAIRSSRGLLASGRNQRVVNRLGGYNCGDIRALIEVADNHPEKQPVGEIDNRRAAGARIAVQREGDRGGTVFESDFPVDAGDVDFD